MGATERDDGCDFDPVLFHGDEQERNAFLLDTGIVGACEAKHPVGHVCHRRPHFRARDGVVCAVIG